MAAGIGKIRAMNGTRAFKLAGFLGVIVLTGAFAAPPGAVVHDMKADFDGKAAGQYRVITSREPIGNPPEDQWYLSIYDPADKMIYQSPNAEDRFALVPRLQHGYDTARMFPHVTVALSGSGNLMGEPRDQVLISVHESGADCGTATLSILSMQSGSLEVPVQVTNPCRLQASVAHHTIILRGPYYNARAPLYKPTINNATATLRYVDNAWVERPKYFKLQYPRVPVPAVTPLTKPTPLFTPIFRAIVTTPAPSGPPLPPRVHV